MVPRDTGNRCPGAANFFILEIPVRFVYKETRGEREV
jgi:hypothetical protein